MSRTWPFFLATLVLILAVTFPWDLQNHPHWQKVAWVPFATGIVRPIDLLGNAALYFPFGFFLPVRPRRARLLIAAVLAALLAGSLEFSQVWSHWRFPSATDVAMNVAGSVAGALVRRATI
jgi:glycopeptide antibiotics resistance protein